MGTAPHIVIVGGGFAGLYAARALAKASVRITLLDRKNHHTFQPLLYQVATAGLSPGEIAAPIRSILQKHGNVEVLLGEVIGFDLDHQQVTLQDGGIDYDCLIVAAGATHAYFGHDEWAPYAPGLKTLEDATEIRRRVLLAFELAERRARLQHKQEQLNIVVVGGGPTGVELAGALVEIARRALASDFRSINPALARIILVEAAPRILSTYPEDLSRSAEDQLRSLGVEVRTNAMVTGVGPDHIQLGKEHLPAAVTLWGAGVAASPLGRQLAVAASVGGRTSVPLDRAGRVIVGPDLTLPGHPEVFVVGDLASARYANEKPVPGVAPAAIQMGEFAAQCIINDLRGRPRAVFDYRDKGSLATIGRKAAVAEFGTLHLSGFVAWLAWLFIHIFFIIGFKNRILIIFEWAWAYFTYQRGARLITGSTDEVAPVIEHVRPSEFPKDQPLHS
ncbi:MAG TPA: NAD(P)/FAD-dependent oxidoreductase [Clostridia bacterium]|nr:NAD(P)/FAD-dependent oxidoreductase [Clostridia bacterium]